MQVTLKLFATLSDYLPPHAVRNAIEVTAADGASVRDLLEAHQVPLPQCHLILVNGIYAAPARAGETHLKPGDTVSVWPPVAGG